MYATELAQTKVNEILADQPGKVFRVSIKGGGCNGFEYEFQVSDPEDEDVIVGEGVVTDFISHQYLVGSCLDFEDTIFSKLFVLKNPNVKSSCGCGKSFGF